MTGTICIELICSIFFFFSQKIDLWLYGKLGDWQVVYDVNMFTSHLNLSWNFSMSTAVTRLSAAVASEQEGPGLESEWMGIVCVRKVSMTDGWMKPREVSQVLADWGLCCQVRGVEWRSELTKQRTRCESVASLFSSFSIVTCECDIIGHMFTVTVHSVSKPVCFNRGKQAPSPVYYG